MWRYEVVGASGKVFDERGGYRSEREAKDAGERAKCYYEWFDDPGRENLTVLVKKWE